MSQFGYSLYISSFEKQKSMFEGMDGEGKFIFTSFHIQEEMDDVATYTKTAKYVVRWLSDRGFQIIGDVSPITLQIFNSPSLEHFVEMIGIHYVRIDYGFSDEEVLQLAERYPICFNASTIEPTLVEKILSFEKSVYGCHNFYPRPETGLDRSFFRKINQQLADLGIHTMAFIPGKLKRGPIEEGLPTLECHRHVPSYVSFLDLILQEKINTVLVGDLTIDEKDRRMIENYLSNGIISIPANLLAEFHHLYDRVFTIRLDSPYSNMRLYESRLMEWDERLLRPNHQIERKIGSITVDNLDYGRYRGEIQILREDRPQDNRVNVIGEVDPLYRSLLPVVENGMKVCFVSVE